VVVVATGTSSDDERTLSAQRAVFELMDHALCRDPVIRR
jgi:hypothetical protein